MRFVKTAVAAVICSQLSGCWFVFIPGSLIQKVADGITGSKGEHCVARSASVGDRITIGSNTGTIRSLSGESVRCTTAVHPIRAEVEF